MRYRLRTLVIVTAVGPVLLALAWFSAIWLWNALPDLLANWGQLLMLLAMLISAGLSIYSIVAPPAGSHELDLAMRWTSLVVAGCQFLALWTGLWLMFGLLAWMFVWGDNQGQREADIIRFVSGLVAAFLAANVAVRGMMGLASRTYLLVNAALAGTVLILVAPTYLVRWLR